MIDETMLNDTDAAEFAKIAEAMNAGEEEGHDLSAQPVDQAAEEVETELLAAPAEPVVVDEATQLRLLEAILFAASTPLDEATIELHMKRGPIGQDANIPLLLEKLRDSYASRGVILFESGNKFSLRSAPDLGEYLKTETTKPVKLSKAMSEVLAIVAYHQPVTRAEIEAIRGVVTSKGTLDFLMEVGWVRPGHRRETPGRPLTWITTPAFLDHFGLASTHELPGMEELKAAGLLESKAVATYGVINPSEAELTAAIDENAEIEPEFLPSAETLEESAEEETAVEVTESDDEDEIVDEVDEDDDFDDDEDDFDDEDDETSDELEEAEVAEAAVAASADGEAVELEFAEESTEQREAEVA
jgi:segregation and condensation protein B